MRAGLQRWNPDHSKSKGMLRLAVVSASLTWACALAAPHPPASPPKVVLFVLADDFGHYETGYDGNAAARTPTLDSLATAGLVLDRHYAYQYCSPTRSSLLSGRVPLHVNTVNHPLTKLGGVDLRMETLPERLKRGANATAIAVGKWHAGARLEGQLATKRGFDQALHYLNGMEDHYTQVRPAAAGKDGRHVRGMAVSECC